MLVLKPNIEGYDTQATDEQYILREQKNPENVVVIARRVYHWLYGMGKFLFLQEKDFLRSEEALRGWEERKKQMEEMVRRERKLYGEKWGIFENNQH